MDTQLQINFQAELQSALINCTFLEVDIAYEVDEYHCYILY